MKTKHEDKSSGTQSKRIARREFLGTSAKAAAAGRRDHRIPCDRACGRPHPVHRSGGEHHQRNPGAGIRGPGVHRQRPGARLRRDVRQDAEPERSVRGRGGLLQRHGRDVAGRGMAAHRHPAHPRTGTRSPICPRPDGSRPKPNRDRATRRSAISGSTRTASTSTDRRATSPWCRAGTTPTRSDTTPTTPAGPSRAGRSCSARTSRVRSRCSTFPRSASWTRPSASRDSGPTRSRTRGT